MAISIAIVIFIFFPIMLLLTNAEKAFTYSIYAIISIFIIAIGVYFGSLTMILALILGIIIYCRCSE